jgi:DNA-directed RNA polymerase subunit RPC12/RpoP
MTAIKKEKHNMNEITQATENLYQIFDALNNMYFNGKVNKPVITIQRTKPNILGHFTLDKVWKEIETDEDFAHEINISAYLFKMGIVQVAETMCHEMVHAKNRQDGIKDVSGQVHNKKFAALATACGLVCTKVKKIGFSTTYSEDFKQFVLDNFDEDLFKYFRENPVAKQTSTPKPTYKYLCTDCGRKFTSKESDIVAICKKCDTEFKLLNPPEDDNGETDTEEDS